MCLIHSMVQGDSPVSFRLSGARPRKFNGSFVMQPGATLMKSYREPLMRLRGVLVFFGVCNGEDKRKASKSTFIILVFGEERGAQLHCTGLGWWD